MTTTTDHPAPPAALHRDDDELARVARAARWLALSTVAHAGAGHVGGPFSATDLLVSLYFDTLRVDPARPDHPERDRFILSKGHAAIGLYSVLALRGYLPVAELATFDRGGSRLQGHPDMRLTPGVDVSTGSLGQGLSVGTGIAFAAKRSGSDAHTWVMVGDGELHEGMVWEAVISAPRYRLDNLTLIVDLNGMQQYGWPAEDDDRFERAEPMGHVDLASAFYAFGWDVREIDGHDLADVRAAYAWAQSVRGRTGRPTAIVARTTKGQGLSFTAGRARWHNGIATDEELAIARDELGVDDLGDLLDGAAGQKEPR